MEMEQSAFVMPTGAFGSDRVPGSPVRSIGSSTELRKSSAASTERDPCIVLTPTVKDEETITLTPSTAGSRELAADNKIPRKRKRVPVGSPAVEASSAEAKQHMDADKICWAPTSVTKSFQGPADAANSSDGSDDDDPHLHSPINDVRLSPSNPIECG